VAPRCYRSSLIAASVPRPPRGLFEPLITHDSPLAIARDLTSLSRSPNPWRNTSWCYPSPSRSLGPATHSAFEAPAPLLASRPHLRLPRQIAHTCPDSPPTLTFCSTTEFISPEAGALLLPGAAPRPSSASSPRVACRLRLLRAPGSPAAFVCFEPPGRLPPSSASSPRVACRSPREQKKNVGVVHGLTRLISLFLARRPAAKTKGPEEKCLTRTRI
jgi:hypothetical protein